MKGKELKLICSIGLVLVLLASILLAACAPAAPTPGAPTRITPQVPGQKQQAPVTVTPTVPKAAKPAAPAPAAEVIKWKFADHMARGSDRGRHQENMIAAIEEMSGGRMEFQYFGAGELLASSELCDAVSKGVVDWNHSGDYWNSILGNVATMENGCSGFLMMEEGIAFWDYSGLLERLREIYAEEANVWYVYPALLYGWADNVYSTKELPGGPMDLVGLPFRTSGMTSRITTKMGAATVWLPWEELYTALQMGTVEACEWGNFSLMWGLGLQEVCPYWYKANIGAGYALAEVIYLPSWEALPADLKAITYTATRAYAPQSSSIVIHDDLAVYSEIAEAVTIGDWTVPEYAAIFASGWKEVMDELGASGDPHTAEVYDIIKSYRMFLNEWPE